MMKLFCVISILIVQLFIPVQSAVLQVNNDTLFVIESESYCDSSKHAHIIIKDILGRIIDIRYNNNVNACISTEHYLNDNLSEQELKWILKGFN